MQEKRLPILTAGIRAFSLGELYDDKGGDCNGKETSNINYTHKAYLLVNSLIITESRAHCKKFPNITALKRPTSIVALLGGQGQVGSLTL